MKYTFNSLMMPPLLATLPLRIQVFFLRAPLLMQLQTIIKQQINLCNAHCTPKIKHTFFFVKKFEAYNCKRNQFKHPTSLYERWWSSFNCTFPKRKICNKYITLFSVSWDAIFYVFGFIALAWCLVWWAVVEDSPDQVLYIYLSIYLSFFNIFF